MHISVIIQINDRLTVTCDRFDRNPVLLAVNGHFRSAVMESGLISIVSALVILPECGIVLQLTECPAGCCIQNMGFNKTVLLVCIIQICSICGFLHPDIQCILRGCGLCPARIECDIGVIAFHAVGTDLTAGDFLVSGLIGIAADQIAVCIGDARAVRREPALKIVADLFTDRE